MAKIDIGKIVGVVVTDVVQQALVKEAGKPTNSLTTKDVPKMINPVAEKVEDAVKKEIQPVIDHLTNNEPWYRSRVTWGAIGAVVLPMLGVVGVSADIIEPDEFVALGVAGGTVVSGLIALWGRWFAKKPLGQ